MESDTCKTPGCEKAVDREDLCFRHRVIGIGFTYVGGGGYGREAFHNGSLAEAIREADQPDSVQRT
jgi:hypothetical protein